MSPPWRLVERVTGRVVVGRLEIADRFWSRFVGLQFRAAPPPGFGLLLAPCASIHTCWMRFALDLVMLDRAGRMVEVRRGVHPWRLVVPSVPTFAILEIPSDGGVELSVGTSLRLEAPTGGGRGLSKSLTSWIE